MRELYALTHDYWSLPISVEYPDDQDQIALVKIGFGIPLLQCQREAAAKALDMIGHRKTPNRWVIAKKNLEMLAKPAPGNPESVVVWRPFNTRVNVSGDEAVNRIGDEFFVEFVRRGVIKDVATAKIVWKSFCLHCLHWMINRRGVVDMLFCQLTPLPYRPNWKHFVLNEELKLQKKKSIIPKWDERAVQAMVSSAPFPLMHPRILWFEKKERLIQWTLDVKPTKLFYRTVAAREEARKHRMEGNYFRTIVTDLRQSIPRALKIYAAFLREISRPGFEYRSFKASFYPRKDKPIPDAKDCQPIPPPEINRAPISIAPGAWKETPCAVFTEAEEAAFVSGMSSVQPPVQELRDAGD